MENFHNGCCHPWTKNPFKNSHSRHLSIVNAVVRLITSRSDRLNEICTFLQTKATHFLTMVTTVNEVSSDETN